MNFIEDLRIHYINCIGNCKVSCLRTIISKTEIQYILDIITMFKFECEPYGLENELLMLNIYLK